MISTLKRFQKNQNKSELRLINLNPFLKNMTFLFGGSLREMKYNPGVVGVLKEENFYN
jgi:hypothetical protein